MKVDVEVKMKAEYIYDLLLFHTYSKLSGFMINLMGLTVIIIGGWRLKSGEISLAQCFVYLLGAALILSFTPFILKMRSKKMMKNPKYKNIIQYSFDGNGIEEVIGEINNAYAWSQVQKAIATPKDIAFYVGEDAALIVPKESFGQNFMPVMKLIADNLTRDKIYIR